MTKNIVKIVRLMIMNKIFKLWLLISNFYKYNLEGGFRNSVDLPSICSIYNITLYKDNTFSRKEKLLNLVNVHWLETPEYASHHTEEEEKEAKLVWSLTPSKVGLWAVPVPVGDRRAHLRQAAAALGEHKMKNSVGYIQRILIYVYYRKNASMMIGQIKSFFNSQLHFSDQQVVESFADSIKEDIADHQY
ncbi:hypothetical protein ACJX0J_009301, partial [Zea mays]